MLDKWCLLPSKKVIFLAYETEALVILRATNINVSKVGNFSPALMANLYLLPDWVFGPILDNIIKIDPKGDFTSIGFIFSEIFDCSWFGCWKTNGNRFLEWWNRHHCKKIGSTCTHQWKDCWIDPCCRNSRKITQNGTFQIDGNTQCSRKRSGEVLHPSCSCYRCTIVVPFFPIKYGQKVFPISEKNLFRKTVNKKTEKYRTKESGCVVVRNGILGRKTTFVQPWISRYAWTQSIIDRIAERNRGRTMIVIR